MKHDIWHCGCGTDSYCAWHYVCIHDLRIYEYLGIKSDELDASPLYYVRKKTLFGHFFAFSCIFTKTYNVAITITFLKRNVLTVLFKRISQNVSFLQNSKRSELWLDPKVIFAPKINISVNLAIFGTTLPLFQLLATQTELMSFFEGKFKSDISVHFQTVCI